MLELLGCVRLARHEVGRLVGELLVEFHEETRVRVGGELDRRVPQHRFHDVDVPGHREDDRRRNVP
ncbi:hypothetical protein [Streptomyces sp. NPDC054863]